MSHLNIEVKARVENQDKIREILLKKRADFKGVDYQKDTYFRTERGRLKLRRGNIENCLIGYSRPDLGEPKESLVDCCDLNQETAEKLHKTLSRCYSVRAVVDKKREIYFIGNVKFHIDEVVGLGKFIEIEAIDTIGDIGKDKLNEQCNHYLKLLEIKPDQLVSNSYSDMLYEDNDPRVIFDRILTGYSINGKIGDYQIKGGRFKVGVEEAARYIRLAIGGNLKYRVAMLGGKVNIVFRDKLSKEVVKIIDVETEKNNADFSLLD